MGNASLALELEGAPPGQTAVLFYGAAEARAPFGNGSLCVAPGSTWTFQARFRDPPAPPAGTNLGDALTITLVP